MCVIYNLQELDQLFKKFPLDKDVCVELVKYIRTQPQFKIGSLLNINSL